MLLALLILGLAIKTDNDYYETGTENFTLIDVNNTVVDFFHIRTKNEIEFAGIIDINTYKIEEVISLPVIGEKIAGKIINIWYALCRYNSMEDIILVLRIRNESCEKNIFANSY